MERESQERDFLVGSQFAVECGFPSRTLRNLSVLCGQTLFTAKIAKICRKEHKDPKCTKCETEALLVPNVLHCGSLLFGHFADHGQLKHLALIRLQQENQPDDKTGKTHQRPNQNREPSQEGNVSHDS